jgi:uncharacterized membrane-anchored protein
LILPLILGSFAAGWLTLLAVDPTSAQAVSVPVAIIMVALLLWNMARKPGNGYDGPRRRSTDT